MNIQFLSSSVQEKEPVKIIVEHIDILDNINDEQQRKNEALLQKSLNQVLDAENILILAGSGTSLTFNTQSDHIAPSMADLWNSCRKMNTELFDNIKKYTQYNDFASKWLDDDGNEQIAQDIELLLSRCDTFLSLKSPLSDRRLKQLEKFVKDAKNKILELTDFTENIKESEKWKHHDKLLRVFGKRQAKQKRLKVFTTNYDLAFETSASNIGMTVIDGFEYSRPYRFNPSWFHYDVVHRIHADIKSSAYLSNVIHLYKIHGSVDWIKTDRGIQKKYQINKKVSLLSFIQAVINIKHPMSLHI